VNEVISAVFHGAHETRAGLERVSRETDRATRRAMVRTSAELRKRIRANAPVRTTSLTRDPPPGDTKRHVHSARPRQRGAEWTGKVSAMGGRRNLYVGKLEQRRPFVQPVAASFDGTAIFREEWEKAYRL